MAYITNHLRFQNGTLQQLWIYDDDDLILLERELDRVDEYVFGEHKSPRGWLEANPYNHEWRDVK